MTQEVWTFAVIAALVIVPRLLLRWGIPAPLSAFGLGLLTLWIDYTFTGAHWSLLATLGITSLFLHAGMEVNVQEWVEEKNRLIWHIGLKMLVLLGVAGTVMYLYQIDLSLAVLIALAIVTPSTGFILNTLGRLQLNESEQFWVRNKAIASEVVANQKIRTGLKDIVRGVREGISLTRALELNGSFPPMMLYMIASGERSGELDSMLERAAKQQEQQLANRIALLVGLFEPAMLVFMGASVLIIVLAILMPILSLNQLIT